MYCLAFAAAQLEEEKANVQWLNKFQCLPPFQVRN